MSAKVISLLTYKVQSLAASPPGYGGLTQADVAYALGRVYHKGAGLLLRIKYADQREFLNQLESRLLRDVRREAMRERWRIHKPQVLEKLVQIAIIELVNPMRCIRCKGREYVRRQNLWVVCRYCEGSGRLRLPNRYIYSFVGLDKRAWDRMWRERYTNVIYPLVNKYEAIGLGSLKKSLS